MSKVRFDIYVKAGSDGKSLGDCPFSQRVNMYAHLKIPTNEFNIIPVDILNKTDAFLKLNPEGKVPVLVDNTTNTVKTDSAEITGYINTVYSSPDLKQDYAGPAVEASAGFFGKLAAFLKNSSPESLPALKDDLEKELKKLDEYLKCPECPGKFLVADGVCEMDCSVLPKLRHVQVAGGHYRGFEIPSDCTALLKYIRDGQETDVFKKTCPPDKEYIAGWTRHNITVVKV